MAARASMATLIAEVRSLINDPNPGSPITPVFTDDVVQEALDHTREDVRYLELAGAANIAPGGVVTWLDYYAMVGSVSIPDWEDDIVLLSYSFAPLTPATSDTLVGHWTFSTDTRPPVYAVGKNYDRYGAAADLCRRWAAIVMLTALDNRTADQATKKSQQREGLMALACLYDAKARPRTLQMVRNDTPQELWTRRNFDISRTSF